MAIIRRLLSHLESIQRRHTLLLPFLGVVCLLVLHAKFLLGSYQSFDLRLWDGSWYWGWGRDVAESFRFPSYENAPLYAAYYAIFHLLFSDPFNIYYIHRVVMLLSIAILLFTLLCRLSSPVCAFLLCAYFPLLIGDGGPAEYAVRSFVLIPVLLGYMAGLNRGLVSTGLVFAAFLAAALVRPEFGAALPFVLAVNVVLDWRSGRYRDATKRRRVAYIAMIAVCVVISIMTTVTLARTSGRSWLAFGQHYGVGFQERHPESAANPWLQWETYLDESFGTAKSVTAAFSNNPSAFVAHVGWNVRLLPMAVDYSLKPAYPLDSGVAGFIFSVLNFFYIYMAVLFLKTILRLKNRRSVPRRNTLTRLWWTVFISLIPMVLAALVIRPSPDHMAVVKVAALLPVCRFLQAGIDKIAPRKSRQLLWMLGAFVAIFSIYPSPFNPPRPRIVVPAVAAIPRIPGEVPFALIADSARSFCNYTDPDRCQALEILWNEDGTKMGGIPEYIQETNTRVIVVGARLMPQLSARWRSYIHTLIQTPETHGWRIAGRTRAFLVLVKD